MKYFFVLGLLFFGMTNAEDIEIFTCPREELIQMELEKNLDAWCSVGRFSEAANSLFELEANEYRDTCLKPLLHDNVHDMKWLTSKAVQDLRQHKFCLEYICETIQESCADDQNYIVEKSQRQWCNDQSQLFGDVEEIKMEQVLIDNQQRKSQSYLREKLRSLEVRLSNLFLPLVQKFFAEYRWFTEKTPTFISNPL